MLSVVSSFTLTTILSFAVRSPGSVLSHASVENVFDPPSSIVAVYVVGTYSTIWMAAMQPRHVWPLALSRWPVMVTEEPDMTSETR